MRITSGKVVDGRVELDAELPEGASVTVLALEGDETFEADAETEQLRAILNVATDGVIILDAEGRILSSNESVDQLFGYQKYDLRGRPFEELFAPGLTESRWSTGHSP